MPASIALIDQLRDLTVAQPRPKPIRYGVAALPVIAVAPAQIAMFGSSVPWFLYTPAVVLLTLFPERGIGVLATVLSAIGAGAVWSRLTSHCCCPLFTECVGHFRADVGLGGVDRGAAHRPGRRRPAARGARAGRLGWRRARLVRCVRRLCRRCSGRVVEDGQAGRTYELAGDASFTMADLAAVATDAGEPIGYRNIDADAFRSMLPDAGTPEMMARILSDTDAGIAQGALFDGGDALSRLIGRSTAPYERTIDAFVQQYRADQATMR